MSLRTYALDQIAPKPVDAEGDAAYWRARAEKAEATIINNKDVAQRQTPCTWWYDDYDCTYTTSCGEVWGFDEGTAEENGVLFCHKCGHPVTVVDKTNRDAEEE